MKRISAALMLALAVVSIVFPLHNSYAGNDEQQRIENLERQITSMQRMMYGQTAYGVNEPGGAEDTQIVGAGAARSLIQINQLEDQIRQLNGRIEQVEFSNKRLTEQLEKFMADVDFRFNAVTTPPAAALTTPPPQQSTMLVPSPPPAANLPYGTDKPLSKQEKYDYAFNQLNQSHFDEAERALREFIREYPDDTLTSNAYYWLGETFYVRKNYDDAAVNFLKGFQRFPKGNKAPDSMLKLGMALGNLDKKKEACATFDKLKKDYPKADSAILQHAGEEAKKISCGS